jgi:hypothetical protein
MIKSKFNKVLLKYTDPIYYKLWVLDIKRNNTPKVKF